MAEEIKNEQHDDSTDTAEKVVEENPPADKEQTPQNAEDNDAAADTTTPDGKSIDPEDQTFWEDSVDANSVDISDGQTGHKEATEENQPAEQKPVAEMDSEQEEAQAEGETADPDTPPAEEEQPEEQEPVADVETEQEEAQTEGETPDPDTPPAEEEQPEEQEPVADVETEQEEEQTEGETPDPDTPPAEEPPAPGEEDNAAAASDEPRQTGKVISFYEYLRKKRLLTGIGILFLIAGSIGFTVVPGLRSSGSGTSPFLGGISETAYDMKFFLPLDVGYEKSQFVKVTIALELMDKGLQKEIDKNISQLRKEVIDLILTKSPKEVKSSSGKQQLSREITSRINNYLSKDCIKGTYFTELVIL